MKGLELLGARGDDSIAERLEVTLEVGQWRIELMSGVDDELAAHSFLLLQALRHLVERVGQRGELVRSRPLHPRLVLTAGDASRRSGDVVERPGQPKREERGEQEA